MAFKAGIVLHGYFNSKLTDFFFFCLLVVSSNLSHVTVKGWMIYLSNCENDLCKYLFSHRPIAIFISSNALLKRNCVKESKRLKANQVLGIKTQ